MQNITISPAHLLKLQYVTDAFKKIIHQSGGISSDQKSSELCQVFVFDCLGAKGVIPDSKREGMQNFWLSAGPSSLRMVEAMSGIKTEITNTIPENEVLPYLIRTFKVAHQTFYPNCTWISAERVFENSVQREPKSTLAYLETTRSHIDDLNIVVSTFKSRLPELWNPHPGEVINEQFTASMCQLVFYVCLNIDSYLPLYQQKAIPQLKHKMQSMIDYVCATIQYIKDSIIERGIEPDEVTEYFLRLFRHLYSKNFPSSRIMDFA